ncbi:hypothetical protein ACSTJ6_02700 [Vibrio parahaemolyticus]|uniref:hypothetical protein n=1 Tax=Vibrio harveyi group TaxID=717610 RepID=UPI001A2E22E4|nr:MULTISPECIES: hypothetical protein [Vibrio harveyi group]EHI9301586.1 hypothetical protein [Vibrio vulnificus]HAV1371946.1 hypothetical protein [Vibrio parahaemolyticus]ELA7387994.1 hypothetical protein [Vibrio alginolyticus]MCR9627997.1 hypothetical protein [Vibrio antiquarius]MCR9631641.1 hypothetical protein [Vibrio antiquarius]
MHAEDLDALMSDDFLDALDENESDVSAENDDRPSWVVNENEHTTFKAWISILRLKTEKEYAIKTFGRVADRKTPISLYQIKKAEVANLVGISSQSIFRASKFSNHVLKFFDNVNTELLAFHEKEQQKQRSRSQKVSARTKKKDELVDDVQLLRKRVQDLEAKNVKETLDQLLKEMPIDLRRKLNM